MSLQMIRIDDRLIHGQVVVGWCSKMHPDRLLLCDDEVAASNWEREIYEEAAYDYQVTICSTDEAVTLLTNGEFEQENVFLIVSSPKTLVRLLDLGLKFEKAVVGGMHHEPGKRKILDFVYVGDEDVESFRFLAEHNVVLECRDLPNCKPIDLAERLSLHS